MLGCRQKPEFSRIHFIRLVNSQSSEWKILSQNLKVSKTQRLCLTIKTANEPKIPYLHYRKAETYTFKYPGHNTRKLWNINWSY